MRKVSTFVPSHLGHCACYCRGEVQQKPTSAHPWGTPSSVRGLRAKRLGE